MQPAQLQDLTKHTCAIVVASEEYPALGTGWKLPGVANKAAEFVDWLVRTRKVPPENVRVFLSGGDRKPFTNLGVPVSQIERAESTELEDAFARLKDIWPNGKVLLIYWVGHGFVGRDGSRRLILGDAIPNVKRNIDVTKLILLLRSDLAGPFSRQIAFIDSCARFFETMQSASDLPDGGLARGTNWQQNIEQNFFFAASAGEYSTKDLFGPYILKLLNELPADIWPPVRRWLWPRIEQAFEALLNNASAKQRPAWLEYNEGIDNSTTRGVIPTLEEIQIISERTGIPVYHLRNLTERAAQCSSLVRPTVRDRLYAAMGGGKKDRLHRPAGARKDPNLDLLRLIAGTIERGKMNSLVEEIKAKERDSDEAFLFRRAATSVERLRAFWPLLAKIQMPLTRARLLYNASHRLRADTDEPSSLEEIVHWLLALESDQPLVEFLLRTALERNEDPQCQALKRWIDKQPNWSGLLADVRSRLDSERQGLSRLMIAIEKRPDGWRVGRAWLWPTATDAYSELASVESQGDLGLDINSLLNEALFMSKVVQIEILVPEELLHLERGFLACKIRRHLIDPEIQYSVVLRWRERMAAPARETRYQSGKWRDTSTEIRKRLKLQGRLYWINDRCNTSDFVAEFRDRFDRGEAGELIGIPLCSDGSSREDLIDLICIAGLPFACWPRSANADLFAAEASVEGLLQQNGFDEFPSALRTLRQDNPRALEDILLLWDDPRHNPYDQKYADVGQKGQV